MYAAPVLMGLRPEANVAVTEVAAEEIIWRWEVVVPSFIY
jgi:hypothetical protein